MHAMEVRIPAGIDDLDAFCRWARSSEFPSLGRYSYLRDEIRVDFSTEQLFTHNRVKLRISSVLDALITTQAMGYFAAHRMLLRNETAEFATEPDGMFISFAAIQSGQAQLIQGVGEGVLEIAGTPDMVLEVISDSSVQKDTVELLKLYWLAVIPEYWLVDVRHDSIRFDILKRGAKAYTATRRLAGGWVKSGVFGRAFHLTQQSDSLGHPQFTLEVR